MAGARHEHGKVKRGAMAGGEHSVWIFAYGSLMWRPGFDYERAVAADLAGWRRCFCVASTHHRGHARRPGLVLGLDRGGSCRGVAYEVAAARAAATLRYLRAREQVNGVYREALLPVRLDDGGEREVWAICYVVERAHPSYAGRLPLARQAALIRGAEGISGVNLDYLVNTLEHLEAAGIREPDLRRLVNLIGPHFARTRHRSGALRTGRSLIAAVRAHRLEDVLRLRPCDRRRFLYRVQMAKNAF